MPIAASQYSSTSSCETKAQKTARWYSWPVSSKMLPQTCDHRPHIRPRTSLPVSSGKPRRMAQAQQVPSSFAPSREGGPQRGPPPEAQQVPRKHCESMTRRQWAASCSVSSTASSRPRISSPAWMARSILCWYDQQGTRGTVGEANTTSAFPVFSLTGTAADAGTCRKELGTCPEREAL